MEELTENPYFQYFIGLKAFQHQPPFDPSLMVYFRKRLSAEILGEINEMIAQVSEKKDKDQEPPDQGGTQSSNAVDNSTGIPPEKPNKGKLLLDATCAPADIRYPTDLSLLNEAREKLEDIIDTLHQPFAGKQAKPRTYRKKARQAYLLIAKQKKPRGVVIHKAIGKQLRYLRRNLRIIAKLQAREDRGELSSRQTQQLETIKTLFEQHNRMYLDRTHSTTDRIVSIHQPHIRPIVRGKAGALTEFGAKVAVSMVNGYAFVEELSWEAFNESGGLAAAVENYRRCYGCYPEAVLADRIYRNRDNLEYCAENGIRLSGPKLGRPSDKDKGVQLRLAKRDSRERNAIEGKFGEGKRSYGLGRIMARLKETGASMIALQFLVMNLERRLRVLFVRLLEQLFSAVIDIANPWLMDCDLENAVLQ